MTGPALSALLSHWRYNPIQLFTMIMGLALATALWSGVQAVNAEARASYDAAASTLGEGRFDQLLPRDGQPVPQEVYIALRRAGWLVSPVVEGRINGQRVVGLDPLTAPGGLGPIEIDEGADINSFLSGVGQIFGTQAALNALDPSLKPERIVTPDLAPGTVITDIGTAQSILGKIGKIDRLIVSAEQPKLQAPLAEVAPSLSRQAAQSGVDVDKLTDSFHLNLTAFGLLSFAVGLFIVNGAIGLAFEQRRPVIRTLRALGLPLRRLLLLMTFELLIFALLAGLLGVVLGYLIASFLLPDVAATLRGLYGADVTGTLQLRPSWWLSGLAIAVAGTMAAGASAFWKLATMPLLAAANPRALVMEAGRRSVLQGGASVILLAAAILLGIFGQGLVAGFAMLAALLIGAALALPLILNAALGVGRRLSSGALAQWFWADTRQQLPGLSLALMALLLAMAANVGVTTMVSSFRLTFIGFLDQRLASELYVNVDDEQQTASFLAFVDDRVDAVLPIISSQTQIEGLPTELFGAVNHATYRDNWSMLSATSDPWGDVHSSNGILINEQLSRRTGTQVGDKVSLDDADFEVVGVYGDYGNPIGQAVIAFATFTDMFPDTTALRFGLRLDADRVPVLVGELESELGLGSANTINQSGIKAFSLGIFDRTFTVTTALNILTLSVAGFAILMSLLTLASMRLPQLAPAWAVGLTRRRLGLLEVLRAIILAIGTTILAIPLGLVLAWVLLAVVNVAAFGWKLPMYFFPQNYLTLAIFAVIAALVAAMLPAIKLSRTPPAQLLKVFSNER